MSLIDRLKDLPKLKRDDFYVEHDAEMQEAREFIIKNTQAEQLHGHDLVRFVHQNIDYIQEKAGFEAATQCHKQQCSFCCHSEIFISETEADYILEHAEFEINQDRLQKQRNCKSYKDLSFADKACIFLKEGRCQIYEHRPALCRNHAAAAGTDPETCHLQNIDQTAGVVINQPRMVILESLNMYLTMRDATSLDDIRNISNFNWKK